MAEELNRRNTESVFQTLKDVEISVRDTRSDLDKMNLAISTLNNRITNLENEINMLRISTMGSGPTVK